MAFVNKRVPGADQFYSVNEPAIGTAWSSDVYPQNENLPPLFKPLTIRGMTFNNRIFVAPMCQYSAEDGHTTDWHLVHIGGLASRGYGAICMEATAVVPEGRISPEDAGLWADSQIAPLQRIVRFAHSQGAKVGVQLAHAGRKASTYAPFVRSDAPHRRVAPTSVAQADENGWPDNTWGPSAIPFSDKYPHPKEMTESELQRVEDAFLAAVERCKTVGFDFIEIHGAHGYLHHAFLSPLSNTRTDAFGGSLANRMRFLLRLVKRMRAAWDKPLFVRISATDWAEGPEKVGDEWMHWGLEQSKILVAQLQELGVDLVDVSTGGNWVKQSIQAVPSYQVPFAQSIKETHPNMTVGAVGMITEPAQANEIIASGKADVVFLARVVLRDPHWPIHAADQLGVAVKPANQYERGWANMLTPQPQNEEAQVQRGHEQGSTHECPISDLQMSNPVLDQ